MKHLTFLIALTLLCACDDGSSSDEPGGSMDASASTDAGTSTDASAEQDAFNASDGALLSDSAVDDAGQGAPDEGVPPSGSAGCGQASPYAAGGAQQAGVFSEAANGERSWFITVPDDYDPDQTYPLIVAFAGTNWSGEMIRPYLNLESRGDAIYVYPDLQFHDFEGWGRLGGWILGPHARPADGVQDIEFVRELLDQLEGELCIDTSRVFATGHSWGGDMAAVVGCFLGDRFTAVAPAAANRPYWFEPAAGPVGCVGESAVWTFFGQNETHFVQQAFPGEFGDEQNAFWTEKHGCSEMTTPLEVGGGDCVAWEGCSVETRYCFYAPDTGHQIPVYFTEAFLDWIATF